MNESSHSAQRCIQEYLIYIEISLDKVQKRERRSCLEKLKELDLRTERLCKGQTVCDAQCDLMYNIFFFSVVFWFL